MSDSEKQKTIHVHDNATASDQLNRFGLSNSLAGLIVNAPDGSSFRIGVYGNWGEGKTSVLSIMQTRLENEGVVCVSLLPWLSKTTEELLDDLLVAIVGALQLEVAEVVKRRERGQKTAQTLSNMLGMAKEASPMVKVASAVVEKTVSANDSRLKAWKGKALLEAVTDELTRRKLTIFVDDLDRVRPALLPDLLLNLRSVLDLPNLFYVLALSPEIVQEGLKEVHPGWSDPLKFLEKIIEYPVFLPKPTEEEMRQFIRLNVEELTNFVDARVLDGIGSLLPRNPRQAKLFLRYLASLQGQLRRFQSDEVSLDALYLCQMMRMEFPAQAQEMVEDSSTLEDIGFNTYDSIQQAVHKKQIDVNDRPEAKYAPKDEPARTRFSRLCTALRQSGCLVGDYSLRDLFQLLERPPVLTWKELGELQAQFVARPGPDGAAPIVEWLNRDGTATPMRASALFLKAVGSRESALSVLIERDTRREQEAAIADVVATTAFLRCLLADVGLMRDGLILPAAWREFLTHLLRYSHWERPRDLSVPLRRAELDLFGLSLEDMPARMQEDVFPLVRQISRSRTARGPLHDSVSPAFKRTAANAMKWLGRNIAGGMLAQFEQPDGIKPVWRQEVTGVQKYMLFDPSSPFYSAECRSRIVALGKQAGNNEVIQKNFLEFFTMLAYGATEATGSFPSECAEVFQDGAYIRMIWRAATAQPLNIRNVGSLLERRKKLMKELQVPRSFFPERRWWKKMVIELPSEAESET